MVPTVALVCPALWLMALHLLLRPWAEIELPIGSVGDPSGVLTAALNS